MLYFYTMALPIFFIDAYDNSDVVQLNEDTSRHVAQVLRMKTGDLLQLTDGKGSLLTAGIADAHKKKCTVTITQKTFTEKSDRNVCIGISPLKNAARFEWFLEKATELGVSEIIAIKCDRTEKQHFRMDRMRNILIAAMLQSQQTWLPVLSEPAAFSEVVTDTRYPLRLIAHCEEHKKEALKDFMGRQQVQILIGPEGDFSPEEIKLALSRDYQPVSLGATRLRTETAGVVAAALLCQ